MIIMFPDMIKMFPDMIVMFPDVIVMFPDMNKRSPDMIVRLRIQKRLRIRKNSLRIQFYMIRYRIRNPIAHRQLIRA